MDSNTLYLLRFILEVDLLLAHINLCLAEGEYPEVEMQEIILGSLASLRKIQHAVLMLLLVFAKPQSQNLPAYDFPPLAGRNWRKWKKRK